MECPKCGRVISPGAFICPGCDYILDATFLGDDITDDERDRRPGRTGEQRPPKPPRGSLGQPDFGEDAMILGDVNQVGEVSSFNSRDAGVSQREVTQARFYIGGAVAQLMMPDAIPEPGAGVSGVSIRMTPFERHVLGFVNGRRSVGRIQKKSAMDESEFKTALAMLADKGFIRLKGWKKQKDKGDVVDGGPIKATMSTSGTAQRRPSASSASSSLSAASAPAAERTVVASMEHIEALARAAADVARKTAAKNANATSPPTAPTQPLPTRPAPTIPQPSTPTPSPSLSPMPRTRVVPSQSSLRATDDRPRDPPGSIPGWPEPRTALEPVEPAPSMATASRRFSSLQAERPASSVPDATASLAVEHVRSALRNDDAHDDDEGIVDPLAAAAAAVWDAGDNQSSVFSDAPAELETGRPEPVEAPPPPRAKKPLVATRPTGHFAAADDDDEADELPPPAAARRHEQQQAAPDVVGDPDGFDDGFTGDGLAALRDPTGMGDSHVGDAPAAEHGAPLDDDDDDDIAFDDDGDDDHEDSGDGDLVDDEDVDAWQEAGGDALKSMAGTVADDDIDDGLLGPPRRIHDERTVGHNPFSPRADIFGKVTVAPSAPVREPAADGFDVDAPATNIRPRPLTLAPSALSPVEPEPPKPPPRNPFQPSAPLPLPRVVTPAPVAVPPPAFAPAPSIAAVVPPAPPPPMSLPGQHLVTAPLPVAAPVVAATPLKPPAPTRVSAASSVPFELRKKAERIYEQALKDQAEGRMSSALMNAKLAMNFDNSVDAYKQLFEALSTQKAAPSGPRPRELVLFEQASEAEGKGDHLKAVKLLQEAIAVNPRAAALHNRIGVVLSIRLKRHDEALAHLKKAIELEPGSIVYMNNFSKVTGLLESVLEKGPGKKKGNLDDGDGKVAVKKIRPKMF